MTYYTSGEFAKKTHVSIRTIRYYDQTCHPLSLSATNKQNRHFVNNGGYFVQVKRAKLGI